MSNDKQPKPENPNNQFSNTEPLTHAQRVAIANTMTNNKQSSVEWYIEKILDLDYEYAKGLITLGLWSERKNTLIEQAKAMHKEEMKDFYFKGWHRFKGNRDEDFDEYYNETFGGKNEQQ